MLLIRIAVLCTLLCIALAALAQDSPRAIVKHSAVLLPVKTLCEWAYIDLSVEAKTNHLILVLADRTVTLTPNSTQALYNGKTVTLPAPLTELNGATYAPLQVFLTGLGMKVSWDRSTGEVSVIHPERDAAKLFYGAKNTGPPSIAGSTGETTSPQAVAADSAHGHTQGKQGDSHLLYSPKQFYNADDNLVASDGVTRFVDVKNGCSVQLPKEWFYRRNPKAIFARRIVNRGDSVERHLFLVRCFGQFHHPSLEDCYAGYRDAMTEQGMVVLTTTSTRVNNAPALNVVLKAKLDDNENLLISTYLVEHGHYIYIIVGATTENEFPNYESEFEDILHSLQFIDPHMPFLPDDEQPADDMKAD